MAEAIQHKRSNKFHQLDLFGNPLDVIFHPIDTIENTGKDILRFVEHPINTTKAFFNDKETATKNFIKNPLGTFKNDFTEVVNAIEKIPTEIRQDVNYIGDTIQNIEDDFYSAGKFIYKEGKIIGTDIYDVGKGAFNFAENSVTFVEKYYKVALFGVGSYFVARWYNELAQVFK